MQFRTKVGKCTMILINTLFAAWEKQVFIGSAIKCVLLIL